MIDLFKYLQKVNWNKENYNLEYEYYINDREYLEDLDKLSRGNNNYDIYKLCSMNTSNKYNKNHIMKIYSCQLYDLTNLLNLDKFMILRLGHMGSDTIFPFWYAINNLDNRKDDLYNTRLKLLHQETGVYPINDENVIKEFCKHYIDSIKKATCIKIWNINFIPELYLTKLNNNIITYYPFSDNTWYEYFKNKRILIISSHVETMKKQWYSNNLFKSHNKNITYQDTGIKLIFLKSYISNCNLTPHLSYLETLKILTDDVSNIADKFDYALVSCGSYGLPICNHIYSCLNKSSIYIGGNLQTFFSIKGKRWDNCGIYNEFWISVPDEFKPLNYTLVENGCYF